jgi:hypothetical protein
MATHQYSSKGQVRAGHAQIGQIVFNRTHLRRTIPIALFVGTVLFAINQLDVVLNGQATSATWIKGAITYVVPFCVANLGVLAGFSSAIVPTDQSPATEESQQPAGRNPIDA